MAYEDLLKDTSVAIEDGNFFLVTITDLDINQSYPIQFRWNYKDGTQGPWGVSKTIVTPGETLPGEPALSNTDVTNETPGAITINWRGKDTSNNDLVNIDHVDVYIDGAPFDGTKPAVSLTSPTKQLIYAPAGTYIVQLYAVTKWGTRSPVSDARSVTVSSVAAPTDPSVAPSAPTVSSVLGAIQLSWNGKTSSGGDQPAGFKAARVYVGTSSGFTPSSSNQVDTLNFGNGQNTLNIAVGTVVNGTALDYGIDYYVKIATTNGTDTSTAVSATGNPVRIGQVTSGDIVTVTADKIATGTISSQTITVGSSSGKHVTLSGTGDPFTIYDTNGTTKLLSYGTNKLSIVGDGTFTGDISGATGTLTNALNVGTASGGLYPFSVSSSGVIRAISGTIAGWTLSGSAISGTNFQINSADSAMYIGPTSGQHFRITSTELAHYNGGSTTGAFTLTTSNGNLTMNGKIDTGYVSIGKDVSGTNDGIYINSSNYWFDSGSFKVGNATSYFGWDTSTLSITGANIVAQSGTKTTTISPNATISIVDTSTDWAAGGAFTLTSGSKSLYLGSTQISFGTDSYIFTNGGLGGYGEYDLVITAGADTVHLGGYSETGTIQANKQLHAPSSSISAGDASLTPSDRVTGAFIGSGGTVVSRRFNGIPAWFGRFGTTGDVEAVRFLFSSLSSAGSMVDAGGININSAGNPSFRTTSDYRLKENIEDYSDGLNKINLTRVRSFVMKSDEERKTQVGFVAHELAEAFPNFVQGEKDAVDEDGNPHYQSIMTTNLIPHIVSAIKEISAKIDLINQRLDALEA